MEQEKYALLGWGLFGRSLFLLMGVSSLLAGIICFFAFNWEIIPHLAKFALLIALMLGAVGLAFFCGPDSPCGGVSLLCCGILAGPLLAVFGQIYQTGANAPDLFFAWGCFLLPLALAARRTSLWLAFWLIATFWLFFLSSVTGVTGDSWWARYTDKDIPLSLIAFSLACLFLWETAARLSAKPAYGFLYSRLFPRIVAFFILAALTSLLCVELIESRWDYHWDYYRYPARHTLPLYFIGVTAAGGWWFSLKRPDTPILAMGMLSLLVLAPVYLLLNERLDWLGVCFFAAMLVCGLAALAVFLLKKHRQASMPFLALETEKRRAFSRYMTERRHSHSGKIWPIFLGLGDFTLQQFALTGDIPRETEEAPASSQPVVWSARVVAVLGAWISLPLIVGFLGFLLLETFNVRDSWAFFVFSLLAAGLGMGLAESPGLFLQQWALALTLAGTAGASCFLYLELGHWNDWWIPLLVCAAGFCVIKIPAYRFSAAMAILLLFMGQLLSLRYYGVYEYGDAYLRTGLRLLPCTAVTAALAHLSLMKDASPDAPWRKPLVSGFLAALLVITLTYSIMRNDLKSVDIPAYSSLGLGCGLGLLFFAAGLGAQLALTRFRHVALVAATALLAALTWHFPWLGIGCFVLALSRQQKNLPLLGLSIIALAVGVSLEYYNMQITLLAKSAHMGGRGFLFLLLGLFISGRIISGIRKGQLPDIFPALTATRPIQTAPREKAQIFRGSLIAAAVCVFFLFFGNAVYQKERILQNAGSIILALRPVDPRSLLQGDYMDLRLEIEDAIAAALRRLDKPAGTAQDTYIAIVRKDSQNQAEFVRLAVKGNTPGSGEYPVAFKQQKNRVVVARSFFFQEGKAEALSRARFAEAKLGGDGTVILTYLLNAKQQRIE
ncbi:hypothetical protein FACS1894168_1360 [Deltaproteobacteria bacterium]|nr:hypothetical protein FACS1894168_1360 [Deltaproteobacteria bacterium]